MEKDASTFTRPPLRRTTMTNANVLLFIMTGCRWLPFVLGPVDRDNDGVPWDKDCDDADSKIGATQQYPDRDADGFGFGNSERVCGKTDGYAERGGDCDDADVTSYPGADEICDGTDNDCDDTVDEEVTPTWFADADKDGYGDPGVTAAQCDPPDGYVSNAADCDDASDLISPDDAEICDDLIDQDCNGIVDDAAEARAWYPDADEDSFGSTEGVLYSCAGTVDGYVLNDLDCDDANASVNPNATEACRDKVDNDCNGEVDTDAEDVEWYRDADSDTYGDAAVFIVGCAPTEGYVGNALDCDDMLEDVNPDAEEVCNDGLDNDCDGGVGTCAYSGTISLASAHAILDGETASDYAGAALANAGDMNGDGFDDLIIGAYGAGTGGLVYVILGPVSSETAKLGEAANIIYTGPTNAFAGIAVVGVGDVDNDGADDAAVGGYGDNSGGNEAGAVWVLTGEHAQGSYALETVGMKFTGQSNDRAGISLAGGSELNGDGHPDLVVGAPSFSTQGTGRAYVVSGPISSPGTLDSYPTIVGENTSDYAGARLTIPGDVNRDGQADLVISSPYNDEGDQAGAIYVVLGPITSSLTLPNGAQKFTGGTANAMAGSALAPIGDLNSDGADEVFVGAYYDDSNGYQTGAAYIVYGRSFYDSLASADLAFMGEATEDQAGVALTSCDMDNDGHTDIMIGARQESAGAYQSGAVYLLFGPLSADGVLSMADAKFTGTNTSDHAGSAMTALDENNDGHCDLVVGANEADPNNQDSGRVYLIRGLGQ